MAAETSGEAHVPVVLALLKLNLLYYYDSYLQVYYPSKIATIFQCFVISVLLKSSFP